MEQILTIPNITFTIGLLGIIFGVYKYFRDPQVDSEKKDAILAQKVQWQTEGTERRFKDMDENFKGLLLQSNNHIHTIEVKIENLITRVNALNVSLEKLITVIDERIPHKIS